LTTLASPSKELLHQTIEQFWETIPPTWHRIRGNLQKVITEHFDVTVEQFHTLRRIHMGIQSTSELAAEKHISRPAISQIVDTLVGKGLLTRHQNTADRRYVRLELTQAGLDLIEAVFQKNHTWMVEMLSELNVAELEGLLEGLQALHKAFGEAVHSPIP
jgi:DNA-binding MarR family transcriptional regulator